MFQRDYTAKGLCLFYKTDLLIYCLGKSRSALSFPLTGNSQKKNRSNQFLPRSRNSGLTEVTRKQSRNNPAPAQDLRGLSESVFAGKVVQLTWSEVFSSALWTLGSVRRTRTQRHCCKSLWSFSSHLSWKRLLFNRQQIFSPHYCSSTSLTAHSLLLW